jgi:signal transduction histidine kinase
VWQTGLTERHPVGFYEDERLSGWGENEVYRLPCGRVAAVYEDRTELKTLQTALVALNEQLEQRVRGRTAELEAANLELQAFTYTVSHDLRAPLTSIGGLALLLEEEHRTSLDDEALQYVKQVRASAERASRLVTSLLSLSRLSRSELSRQEIDLSQMALDIVDDLRRCEPGRCRTGRAPPRWPGLGRVAARGGRQLLLHPEQQKPCLTPPGVRASGPTRDFAPRSHSVDLARHAMLYALGSLQAP